MAGERRDPQPNEPQSRMDAALANLEALRQNPYPGRGIVQGIDSSGQFAVQVYWLTGRDPNSSQNRILVREGDTVCTAVWDRSKLRPDQDLSLIIYNAMRVVKLDHTTTHIVSNGSQTDNIARALPMGMDYLLEELQDIGYEPDAPNYTSRISGFYQAGGYNHFYLMRVARQNFGDDPNSALLDYTAADMSTPGIGRCLHTYAGNDSPLPAFMDAAYDVPIQGTIDQIAETYWDILDRRTRVALIVKTIDVTTGATDFRTRDIHEYEV